MSRRFKVLDELEDVDEFSGNELMKVIRRIMKKDIWHPVLENFFEIPERVIEVVGFMTRSGRISRQPIRYDDNYVPGSNNGTCGGRRCDPYDRGYNG